ncbi:hypothetical protein CCHL11_08912 [Colletotrichum chlorophyti]|uniref:Uncharacterized protein n=1 Tax=Colletotrichum chlorophyti TaxID=708187 RepID=A0A1Q8RBV2_9PEZI|nr:hypothetical protein CCHL11_08912 [Colletotrichum chlorophyti]
MVDMDMDMNDATRLIGDLHQKLADLDNKVAAYRQEMANEFHRYSRQLLQNLPHHISAEVDRVVAASLDNYPALRPALTSARDHTDSPPPPFTDDTESLTENPRDPRESPTPTPPTSTPPSALTQASTATLTSPDSAYDRERDRELHGLFTPSYLPLLDSSHSSPVANQSPTLSSLSNPAADNDEMGRHKSGQAIDQPPVQLSVASSQNLNRPNHERRATDDTTYSSTSEQSEFKLRRSALRRTSSGSKPLASPRRVRFEFEGEEVLPTSSPQTTEPSLVMSHSLASSRSPPPSDEESMIVESLLGADDDIGPPPKKVSSSQALRALSRAPLDANTVWTVVNPDAQDSSERDSGSMPTSGSESSLQTNNTVQHTPKPQVTLQSNVVDRKRIPEPPQSPSPDRFERPDNDGDDSSSDDGFLAMAKPKSFANKKAILSPISRSPTRTVTVPHSSSPQKPKSHAEGKRPPGRAEEDGDDDDDDDDDDDLFHFEGLSAPPKPRPRPAPIREEDEDDDVDAEVEANGPVTQTLYSTSPAVSIPKAPEPAIPAHLISGSVGSFRGRPVTMPIVKNPDVYQQAASLGDVSSFIGGLDGRSGVDDGDLNSYRASVGQSLFSGTPRSLTERMMMEEAQTQRRASTQRPH